jgi:hypothetical protein
VIVGHVMEALYQGVVLCDFKEWKSNSSVSSKVMIGNTGKNADV